MFENDDILKIDRLSRGRRLQEERKKMALSQEEFGDLGGVKRGTQITYESGERAPDADYLTAIAAAGADVNYILTGMRTPDQITSPQAGYTLTPRHQAVLQLFDALCEDQQQDIFRALEKEERLKELRAEVEELKDAVKSKQ